MPALACLNGEFAPPEETRVSIWDRAFLFGDAVYDVWRIYNGRLWLDDAHTNRLRRSLGAIRIERVDFERLKRRMLETMRRAALQEAIIYVQISRGVALRKHAFPDPSVPPTELIVVLPYDDAPTAELRLSGVEMVSQPDLRWKCCDIKSVNLLANVLANQAAREAAAYEAVLVDAGGFVTEATHSSLMWVHDGILCATGEGREILPGTTRGLMLELARDCDLPFHAEQIRLHQLMACDEVILAGTTIEVMPVVRVDGMRVKDGKPGPVTRRLQQAFRTRLNEWLRDPADRREGQ